MLLLRLPRPLLVAAVLRQRLPLIRLLLAALQLLLLMLLLLAALQLLLLLLGQLLPPMPALGLRLPRRMLTLLLLLAPALAVLGLVAAA